MNTFTISIAVLCGVASWSVYQVIYGLRRGKVRRFSWSGSYGCPWIPLSPFPDAGYCMRVAEPGWFWYHLSIYALQGVMASVLPVHALWKMML